MNVLKGKNDRADDGKAVAVAMSGGVDSSVAACLLSKAGCRVIGVTMRLFCYASAETTAKSCCNLEAIADARAVCRSIDAPHYVIDCEEEFSRLVIDRFVEQYLAGCTPNPCVDCNRLIKFNYLLERARSLGVDYLATGHYVRKIQLRNGLSGLARGLDPEKDQSYFLWSIPALNLSSFLFPLGDYRKKQVRKLAEEFGLQVSQKQESQEVCFIGSGSVRSFLRKYYETSGKGKLPPNMCPGPLVDTGGRKLGQHRGSAFYTVGQRRGLNVSLGKPAYVTAIDAASNTVVLGNADDLMADLVEAGSANYIMPDPEKPFRAQVQVRYRQKPAAARVFPEKGGKVCIRLDSPMRAITPGQSLVFYDGEILLGGAVIETARMA